MYHSMVSQVNRISTVYIFSLNFHYDLKSSILYDFAISFEEIILYLRKVSAMLLLFFPSSRIMGPDEEGQVATEVKDSRLSCTVFRSK